MCQTHPLRRLASTACRLAILTSLLTGLLLAAGRPAGADDVDLLRFDTGNAYLFIILDTSGSMNLPLAQGATPLPGDGDAPGSRIYEAKKALYNVLREVDDVHFGLATYNQDQVRVVSKHWLYVPSEIGSVTGWPLTGYPALSDVLTFGAHLGAPTAGSCASPLSLDTQRDTINRFSKLGKDLATRTDLWVTAGSAGNRYLLSVTKVGGGGPGSVDVTARFTTQEYSRTCVAQGTPKSIDVKLRPGSPFGFLMYDGVVADEGSAGAWSYQDTVATGTLGADRPFTGRGWEGNYDSVFDPLPGSTPFEASLTSDDAWCQYDANNVRRCLSLRFPTTRHPDFATGNPYYPEADSGDILGLDWRQGGGNKNEILRRLAPNLRSQGLSAVPDFGIASYFRDAPDFPGSGSSPFIHDLVKPGEIPIIAYGNSPLGRAVNDFRCWWRGTTDIKCRGTRAYTQGFEALALQRDPEWGCRRTYLLLVTDGEDNSTAESPNADASSLFTQSGIETWALNLGNPSECLYPNKLHSITNLGRGECLTAGNPAQIEEELRTVLGKVREETSAFASAAVPSVQATVDDKIFLTSFTPLRRNETAGTGAVWDGHVHSFLKPLPLKDDRPDTTLKCSSRPPDQQAQCHLWDAGEILLAQAPGPPSARPLSDAAIATADVQQGTGYNQRRVFYAQDKAKGTWTDRGRLLTQTQKGAISDAVRRDLWAGLGISFTAGDLVSEAAAEKVGNQVVVGTLWEKQAEITQTVNGSPVTRTVTFALGDTFHANPLVVGSPAATRFYAENAGTQGKTCEAGDPGFRCYFLKHEKRRRMLMVASNDGLLHAFDGGQWDASKAKFDNGTGRELFAFLPRTVMPRVRDLVQNPTARTWSVDGSPKVADVFLDPVHGGTPDASKREWRTVLLGGLRQGGNGYYALDITQPDKLDPSSVNRNTPVPVNTYVPSCTGVSGGDRLLVSPGTDCGRAPFPAVLWEFVDAAFDASGSVVYDSAGRPVLLDEEGGVDENGDGVADAWYADLGETWSVPNVGRIKLCEGTSCAPNSAEVKDRFVAVFGGGMDPDKKDRRGNYIYMVDIESGRVIYKRRLDGSAPSEPAAVDVDQDGYLDRIYIGTTRGVLYRIDLGLDSGGKVPKLETDLVTGTDGRIYPARRVRTLDGAGQPQWTPKAIFTTGGRPIHHRPSVVFVAALARYALLFGTGDREDLWSRSGSEGRFYVFVDETENLPSTSLPMVETRFQEIQDDASDVAAGTDYLLGRPAGTRGWYIRLDPEERVITDAFALSGVTFFTSYQPETCVGLFDPETNVCTPSTSPTKVCAKTGKSRIFVVSTSNANSFMAGADGQRTKFAMVSNFVTNPYVEPGQTKNPLPVRPGENADQLTASLKQIMEELKKLFPKSCKFANYRLDIKTISSDTGVVFIAPVPVCVIEKNWKEL